MLIEVKQQSICLILLELCNEVLAILHFLQDTDE